MVVDEFDVKGTKVLSLDKKRTFDDFEKNSIIANGKKYSCGITHNEYWITVQTKDVLNGAEIIFS